MLITLSSTLRLLQVKARKPFLGGDMRYRKVLAHLGLLTGLGVGGARTLVARDWDDTWRGRDYKRHDIRHDYRDLSGDYARVSEMRADIVRDRARLNEDISCG